MKLKPLKPVPASNEAAASVKVRCLKTGVLSSAWNEAVAAGWVFDADGAAFAAYYSPEAVSTLTPEEAESLSSAVRSRSIHF